MPEQGHDGETRVSEEAMTGVLRKLAAALPPGHPAFNEASGLITAMWRELGDTDLTMQATVKDVEVAKEVIAAHGELGVMLDDWRRGIRDWGEVDDALRRARTAAGKLDKPRYSGPRSGAGSV